MAVNNDLYQSSYRDIALENVRKDGLYLKHVDRKSIYYEQIARAAVAQNPLAIKYVKASEPFYNILASQVINNNPQLIKHIDRSATNYATLAEYAVNQDVKLLKKIDKKNEAYKSLAYNIASENPKAKKYVKDRSVKQVIKLDSMDKNKHKKRYDKLATKAVKKNLEAIKHVSRYDAETGEVVYKSIRKNANQIKYIGKDAALRLIGRDKELYENINDEYKKDKDFMIDVVSRYDFKKYYSKIDNELLDNEEFVRGVIYVNDAGGVSYGAIMEHASSRLKDNKEFILDLVKDAHQSEKNKIARYASDRLLSQKDFVSNTGTLYFANDSLRSDRQYVLNYMKKYNVAMYVASDSLRNDKDFVLHCINKTTYGSSNFGSAGDDLRNDKDVARAALKVANKNKLYPSSVTYYMGKDLLADSEFMLELINDNLIDVSDASEELRKDKSFVMDVIKQGKGYAFADASDELKNDKELARLAIENGGAVSVMKNAGNKIRKDTEIIKAAAAKSGGYSLEYVDKKMLKDKKLVLSLIGDVPAWRIAEYIEPNLLKNKNFMLEAIEKDKGFYNKISKELTKDKKFMAKADEIHARKLEEEEQAKIEQEKQQKKLEEQKVENKKEKTKKSSKKKEQANKGNQEIIVNNQKDKVNDAGVIEQVQDPEKKNEVEAKVENKKEKVDTKVETKKRASTKAMGSYDNLSSENKAIYDAIMKKSFTNVFKSMNKEHEAYLKGIYKEAYDKVKAKDPKEYTSEDVQVIALLTKLTKKRVQAQDVSSKTNDEIKNMMDEKVKEKKVTSSSR